MTVRLEPAFRDSALQYFSIFCVVAGGESLSP